MLRYPRYAEVRYPYGSVFEQHDIGGLDVAVHNPVLVRVIEGLGRAGYIFEHFIRGEQGVLRRPLFKVVAFEQLHGYVGYVLLFSGVKDLYNIRVRQVAGGLGFAEKALFLLLHGLFFKAFLEAHCFYGHGPVYFRVHSQVDYAHRAFAQLFFNLVASEHGRGGRARHHHGCVAPPAAFAPYSAEDGAVRGFLQDVYLGFYILEFRVFVGDMFVDRDRFVILALALKIQRQVVKGILHIIVKRAQPELFKGQVQHSLSLEGKPQHLIGLYL